MKFLFWTAVLVAAVVFGPRGITELHSLSRIQAAEAAPAKPVAIVFGAGLRRDGWPTAVLRDRVRTAAELYFDGKVEFLLLSGDNSSATYNEPAAMFAYAQTLGVPAEALVMDFAGLRTYDTCYRAAEIFAVEEAILVTQAYHLPRALYTCSALGISVLGVPAYESRYWEGAMTFWKIREIPATLVALWEVHVSRPLPILGEPEPIMMEAQ